MSTTPIALAALDGGGKAVTLRADQNPDNTIALRASLEIGGAAVGAGNAVPVADVAVETALGSPADAAWAGTGSGSTIAVLKAVSGQLGTLASEDNGLATAAGQASALTQQTAAAAALGTPADAAWGGAGGTTAIGALKALWAAVTGTLKVAVQAGSAVIGKVGIQVAGADVAQGNPVYARLTDGTNALVLTPQGSLAVAGQAAVGGAPTAPPVSVSGVDQSGNKQHIRTDTSGVVQTADANGAAFQGVLAITPGTPVTAARSLAYVCTASGNVTLTLADASTITLALQVSPAMQTLPFAVTNVALGSGTAGTFWNLK